MSAFTIRNRRAATSLAVIALGGAGAATVFTPVAQADTSLNVVRSHLRSADVALHNVAASATTGSLSGPLAALEAQIRAAGLGSAKLYRLAHHTHSAALNTNAATAMTKLAGQQNRDATVLTPLLGQLSGADQTQLATFLATIIQGREQALTLATGLIGQLPPPAQTQVAGIVAQLSNAGTGQAGLLAGAISPGSIACPAIAAVSSVIAAVLASIQADLVRIQSMIAAVPGAPQGQISGLVQGLPAQLNSLLASIAQAFNCASTTPAINPATGTTPAAVTHPLGGALLGSVGSLVSEIVEFIQKLLSSFLPGIDAGQTPSPVTFTGQSSFSSLSTLMSFGR
jgi:hypothetical protein